MVMALETSTSIVATNTLSTAWRNRARVEKASASATLHGERDDADEHQDFEQRKPLAAQTSRNGTGETVREWDERRLIPTFVTQVLAQYGGKSSAGTQISAAAAYGQGFAAQIALLCDRSA
jgi:hypothetical protein